MWAILCRRLDILNTDPEICFRKHKLCSTHFIPSEFNKNRLNYTAMPSIFEWTIQSKKNNNNNNSGDNINNNNNNNDKELETIASLTVGTEDAIPNISELMVEGIIFLMLLWLLRSNRYGVFIFLYLTLVSYLTTV